MEKENQGGIGLFALVAIIVSGAIGGGVFNLASQLATGATPGGVIISWLVIGFGILMLVLALNYLVKQKPELSGVSDYARAGFGDFFGFLSGWGYWLSSWLGNIAFAVLLVTSVNYFFKGTFVNADTQGLTFLSLVIVSLISWGLTVLVIKGVESAAVINAIVLVAKLIPLAIFAVAAVILFRAGVFTHDFWANVAMNSQGVVTGATGHATPSDLIHVFWLGGHGQLPLTATGQIPSSLLFMVWVFVGVEGAAMMGDRAKRKSDAGRASLIGLLTLLVIYLFLSILPFGFMNQAQLAASANTEPGLVHILNAMVGGWGGSVMAIGLIITLLGAWLSWTMLPVEATQQLAEQKLLPELFGELNKNKAPEASLWITAIFVQVFLIIAYLLPNSYNLFVYMCTAAIMICYALVGAYMMKLGITEKRPGSALIGFLAAAFQIIVLYWTGWQYIWAVMVLYAIGCTFFYYAKRENGKRLSVGNVIGIVLVNVFGFLTSLDLITGWSGPGGQFDLRGILGTEDIKPGFGKVMGIVFLVLLVIFLFAYLLGGRFDKGDTVEKEQ